MQRERPSRPPLHSSVPQKERVVLCDSPDGPQQGTMTPETSTGVSTDARGAVTTLYPYRSWIRKILSQGPTYMVKARHLFKSLANFGLCLAQWKRMLLFCISMFFWPSVQQIDPVSYWLTQFFQLLNQSTTRDVMQGNPLCLQHKGSDRAAAERSHPAVLLTRCEEEHQPECSPMAPPTLRAEHSLVPVKNAGLP